MERNLANIYQVELYKTKKIISKLKDLGLNTTNINDFMVFLRIRQFKTLR